MVNYIDRGYGAPLYTPNNKQVGNTYWDVSTGIMYVWDGSYWVHNGAQVEKPKFGVRRGVCVRTLPPLTKRAKRRKVVTWFVYDTETKEDIQEIGPMSRFEARNTVRDMNRAYKVMEQR